MTTKTRLRALTKTTILRSSSGSTETTTTGTTTPPKHIIYDFPVSNNGARCRIIAYKKGIPDWELKIVSPTDALGGHKTESYLSINPQGKVPSIVINDGQQQQQQDQPSPGLLKSFGESDTICQYLMSHYDHIGPSFQPNNVQSNTIARFHDMYLTTIQGCMYKATPPFGSFGTRKDALKEYIRQLQIIENLIVDDGSLYLCGKEVSYADAALFPSMVFAKFMLPKFDIQLEEEVPVLTKWHDTLLKNDAAFSKVSEEILAVLKGSWEAKGRWDSIYLAGVRDEDPETIFDKIIAKEIPASIVMEDDKLLAFEDINPAAPAHVLVIPKDRAGLSRLQKSSPEHIEILGRLLLAAGEISKNESLGFGDGARVIINDGPDAGQEVPHLHLHVLGGRHLTWPPG